MENFKRSVKRLITRLTVLGLVVICGAIAIAQANKDRVVANAAAPDLSQPADVFNDVGNAVGNAVGQAANKTKRAAGNALNALAVKDLQEWAEPTDNQPQPQDVPQADYIADAKFTTAQATQEVPSRFNDQFPTQPAPETAATSELAPPNFSQPERIAQSGGAPPLFNDGNVPVQNVAQPALPPRDTALQFDNKALADSPYAQPQDKPSQVEAPAPVQPPPAQQNTYNDRFAAGDRFGANDQFGNGQRPANPMRGNTARTDALSTTNAPAATVQPVYGSNAPQQNYDIDRRQPASNDYAASDYAASPTGGLNEMSGGGKPGPTEQEGPQNTSLMINKIAPKNVRVGQPATFEIRVRNNSQVPAENVLIRDEVPAGTQLVDTNPQATADSNGGILWQIGTLRPNEDVSVSMRVRPLQEGTIGSVASVTHQSLASARAEVKKPMLKIVHSTKDKVLVGDTVRFAITIENPGSGPATNVVVEEDVPQGLAHSKGPKLEYEIGTIPANGRRRLELSLKADKPGMVENVIVARGADGLISEHRLNLEVIAPQLQVKINGPSRRYLERKATYTVAVENAGTADAQNVEIVTQLPPGVKFVSTNNSGRYDAISNSIRWTLARLPARQFGEVQFTLVPMTKGEFNIAARAKADKGLQDSQDHPLAVQGLAALLFEVKDNVDPIEVGGVTTYQIRVQNQGTKEASNVQFVAVVPPGMRAVGAQGPTNYRIQGNQVVFDAINRLPAKAESTYSVRVEGVQPDDHRFKVQMTSDNTTSPVVEEESTRVYAD